MKYTDCPICNKQISNSNYSKHLAAHNKPNRYLRPLTHDGLNCQYCGKLCKHRNSLAQHEIRCSYNTSALKVVPHGNFISHTAWNKGLTKEIDERVAQNAEQVKNTLQHKVNSGWKPFFATEAYWTAERREKRSNEKIQFYQKYPEKHPNRTSVSRMTYPEKLTAQWLTTHNINFIPQYKTNFQANNRFVDFFLPDHALYIEVDGEYWHTKQLDIDKAKDIFALQQQGIKTLRIKPKAGVERQLEQFFKNNLTCLI